MAKRKSCRRTDLMSISRYFHSNTLSSGLPAVMILLSHGHGNRHYRSKESKPNACRNFHCTRRGGGGGAGPGCEIGNGRSSGRSVYSANNWAHVRCLDTQNSIDAIIWVKKWYAPELHCCRSTLRQPRIVYRCPLGHWYCRPYPIHNGRPVWNVYILAEFWQKRVYLTCLLAEIPNG